MDNFKIIYRILRHLERAMDCEITDPEPITHTALGITRERWERILIMLQDNGYIDGVLCEFAMTGGDTHIMEPIQPSITLKGLEYLAENSIE